ncbi:hypothetical protein QBC42DRAFT_290776, partial [Cladorrhinum samala]
MAPTTRTRKRSAAVADSLTPPPPPKMRKLQMATKNDLDSDPPPSLDTISSPSRRGQSLSPSSAAKKKKEEVVVVVVKEEEGEEKNKEKEVKENDEKEVREVKEEKKRKKENPMSIRAILNSSPTGTKTPLTFEEKPVPSAAAAAATTTTTTAKMTKTNTARASGKSVAVFGAAEILAEDETLNVLEFPKEEKLERSEYNGKMEEEEEEHSDPGDSSYTAHCESPRAQSPSVDNDRPSSAEEDANAAAEDEDVYSSSHEEHISAAKDDDAFSNQLQTVVTALQMEKVAGMKKRAVAGSQMGRDGNEARNMSSKSDVTASKRDSPWRKTLDLIEISCKGRLPLEKKEPCVTVYYQDRQRHLDGPVELPLDVSTTEDTPCRVLDYGDSIKRYYSLDDGQGFRTFRLSHEAHIGAVAIAEASMRWLILEGLRIDEGGVTLGGTFAKSLVLSGCEVLGPVKMLCCNFGIVTIKDCTFKGGLHVWNSTIMKFGVTRSTFEEKELCLSRSCIADWLKIEDTEMDVSPVLSSYLTHQLLAHQLLAHQLLAHQLIAHQLIAHQLIAHQLLA